MRNVDGRYGPLAETGDLVMAAAEELDVLLPARRSTIAPLLASVEPDLVVCMGFPWKIPPDALAVPRLGWLNGHPSLLPRHRGPLPVAWAIREGDEEIGITVPPDGRRARHRADPRPAAVSRSGSSQPPDTFYPELGPTVGEALGEALEKLAAGDEGDAAAGRRQLRDVLQPRRTPGSTSPARRLEVHRLVWAWRYAFSLDGTRGALLERDGDDGARARHLADARSRERERLDCGDGPLWIVETEELSEEEATPSTDPAPSTQ